MPIVRPTAITASSFYSPANSPEKLLRDGWSRGGWISQYGDMNPWIECKFAYQVNIHEIGIANGFISEDKDDFYLRHRVREFTIFRGTESLTSWALLDSKDRQWLRLPTEPGEQSLKFFVQTTYGKVPEATSNPFRVVGLRSIVFYGEPL